MARRDVPRAGRVEVLRRLPLNPGGALSTSVPVHGAGDVGRHRHLVEAQPRRRGCRRAAPDLACHRAPAERLGAYRGQVS